MKGLIAMKIRLWVVAIAVLVILPALSAQNTGWKIEQITYELTKDGKKTNEQKQTIYVSEKAVRIENKDGITILKLEGDSAVLYRLMPQQKQYMTLSPSWLVMGMFGSFMKCDDQTGCQVDTTTIKPTDEYETINGYKARKVNVTVRMMGMMEVPGVQWMTKDWKELIQAMKLYMQVFKKALLSSSRRDKMLKDLFDYFDRVAEKYGQTVKSETQIFGRTSVTETVAVKQITVSSDLFKIPPDYKQVASPFDMNR